MHKLNFTETDVFTVSAKINFSFAMYICNDKNCCLCSVGMKAFFVTGGNTIEKGFCKKTNLLVYSS